MTPAVSTAELALTDATLEQLLAAVQARFEREYSKTTKHAAERLNDKDLAKTWRTFDEFCRGFQRVGKKYEENRKVLAEEMKARGFEPKNEDEGVVGTVIRLTRRLFARTVAKSRTGMSHADAWNALKDTLPADSPVRATMATVEDNLTKTTTTLGFEYLDYDPGDPTA